MAPQVNLMHEQIERASRKPYTTANSKREALIEKIQDRYNRTPTANELLAVDNIPCGPRSQLFDRSRPGVYIYERLRYAEDHTDVTVLEEAGRILRVQMANAWTPTSSIDGDGGQSSSSRDLFEQAHKSHQLPRQQLSNAWTPTTSVASDQSFSPDPAQEHVFSPFPRRDQDQHQHQAPTQPTTPNISYTSGSVPLRPKPSISISSPPPAQNGPPAGGATTTPLLPAAVASAVTARVIHGDVYYMPISLRFDGQVSNSSIAVHVPGRATAAYAQPLVVVTVSVEAQEGAKDT